MGGGGEHPFKKSSSRLKCAINIRNSMHEIGNPCHRAKLYPAVLRTRLLTYLLVRLNVHSNFLLLIRDGGKGRGYLCPTTYTLHCHHQNHFCVKTGSCVKKNYVSWIVWGKSRDSVHKPQFLKRESRSGSKGGPSAYQPSALPLGHTGSQELGWTQGSFYSLWF